MIEKLQDAWWFVAVAGAGIVTFLVRWAVRLYGMQTAIDDLITRLNDVSAERDETDADVADAIGVICRAVFCLLDREVEDRGANGAVKATRNELRDMLAKRL